MVAHMANMGWSVDYKASNIYKFWSEGQNCKNKAKNGLKAVNKLKWAPMDNVTKTCLNGKIMVKKRDFFLINH